MSTRISLDEVAKIMAQKYQGPANMGTALLFPNDKYTNVTQIRDWMSQTKFSKMSARIYQVQVGTDTVLATIENQTYGVWTVWLSIKG